MNRRTAKRMVTVRISLRGPDGRERTDPPYRILAPHSWKRLRNYYLRYDTAQVMEHDPNLRPRMVAVLARKPRAGRKRS